jgi:hypothetical protein
LLQAKLSRWSLSWQPKHLYVLFLNDRLLERSIYLKETHKIHSSHKDRRKRRSKPCKGRSSFIKISFLVTIYQFIPLHTSLSTPAHHTVRLYQFLVSLGISSWNFLNRTDKSMYGKCARTSSSLWSVRVQHSSYNNLETGIRRKNPKLFFLLLPKNSCHQSLRCFSTSSSSSSFNTYNQPKLQEFWNPTDIHSGLRESLRNFVNQHVSAKERKCLL